MARLDSLTIEEDESESILHEFYGESIKIQVQRVCVMRLCPRAKA